MAPVLLIHDFISLYLGLGLGSCGVGLSDCQTFRLLDCLVSITAFINISTIPRPLQCSDTVGQAIGKASGL